MSTRFHISQLLRAVSWLNDEQRENSWWICWSKSIWITLNIALAHVSVIIKPPIVWTNWNLTRWCHLNTCTPAQLQATLIPNVSVTFHFKVISVTTQKGLFSCWLLSAAIAWNALCSKWTFCILLTCHTGNCFLGTLKHSNEHLQEVSCYLWNVSQWCK